MSRGFPVFGEKFFEGSEAVLQRAERALHLPEAAEGRGRAEPFAVVEGGDAGEDFPGGDVVARGALGGEHHVVADGEVAGDADLSGEDDAAADVRASGQAHLRADE